MSSIQGGKNNYKCLYSLIRRESPVLYDCINDLCIDGLFRNQRYKNTFLMPSKDLVNKVKKMIDDDDDENAIKVLKSLILKDHWTKSSLSSAKLVGTVDNLVLKSPTDVAKACDKTNLKCKNSKDEDVIVVLSYSGPAPECVEGENVAPVKVGAKVMKGGSNVTEEKKHIDKVVSELYKKGNVDETLKNFASATASLVSHMCNNDVAIHYLASNPVLSFFFLTMNGSKHAPVKHDALVELELSKGLGDLDDLKEIMDTCEFDRSTFNQINTKRSELLQNKGDRTTLPGELVKVYEKLINSHDTFKNLFGKCPEVKLLMDELRFLYEDATSEEELEELLVHLKSINWDNCARHSIMSDSKLYKSLVKCPEAFASGPTLFVKSVYFMYLPINSKISGALDASRVGGGAYANMNPMNINSAVFKGGAMNKKLTNMKSNSKLNKLVNTLSKKQKEELKKLL